MENTSENMKTLSQVMTILAKRGVTKEFRMNENNEMKLENGEKNYNSDELIIAKTYRFEGDSNPDDNAVLLLVKSTDGNIGFILDSYGAESNYSGEEFDDFLRRIPESEDPEYNLD
ncbi:hypothetical protein [Frigoriflavimonas asaccharolytica]|uniref:Phosphoribosylpyrophosphate synthetase n=1 Tax=Frigoriflavimonas asaccharolytica TaxID=2735899 RepID=A0A8J8GA15_9FLAO|nr:hypothetical protein [Frigoriflavimonas asaccharolytica]NRS93395.1 hypothetical protein [Frigoriflavimonas asaccharolytica]